MLKLASPAKVNLFLSVLKKRQDGYHELASLFQAIDLCDFLHMRLAAVDRLTCSDPKLPTDAANLVHKALVLFRSKTGLHSPVEIHLEKHIPVQAGLGGGSGNAATTLWGLNELFGRPATDRDLALWAAEIGSDIAFFFSHGTAYCTGRGEIVRQLPPLPPAAMWIVKPQGGLPTPQVFSCLKVSELAQRDPVVALEEFIQGDGKCFNDLEGPAFMLMPELADLKKQLRDSGFSDVVLCGSGSSLCCMGDVPMPQLPAAATFRVRFMRRQPDAWFSC